MKPIKEINKKKSILMSFGIKNHFTYKNNNNKDVKFNI